MIFDAMRNKIKSLPILIRFKIGRLRLTKSEKRQIKEMAEAAVDRLEDKILAKFIEKYHWNKQQQEDFRKGFRRTRGGHVAVFKMWFSLAMRLNKIGKKFDADGVEDKIIAEMEARGIFNHENESDVLKHVDELQKEYKKEANKFYNENKKFIGRIDDFEGDVK